MDGNEGSIGDADPTYLEIGDILGDWRAALSITGE